MKPKRRHQLLITGFVIVSSLTLLIDLRWSRFPFWYILLFLNSIAFLLVLAIFITYWKNTAVSSVTATETSLKEQTSSTQRSFLSTIILLLSLLLFGGLLILLKQDATFTQSSLDEEELDFRHALLESNRASGRIYLMANLLDNVDEELKQSPTKTLRNETIARIADLSHTFKPYHQIDDSYNYNLKFSPERGQLLVSLAKMEMDSISWKKIKWQTTFDHAELSGVNLKHTDLSEVKLMEANLKNALLDGVNFDSAKLIGSNFWNVEMEDATLIGAELGFCDFSWANCNRSNFDHAYLSGAELTAAKFKNTSFVSAKMRWAFMNDAFFNEANMVGIDLLGSTMKRTHFEKVNLSDANMYFNKLDEANLHKANLTRANLAKSAVDLPDWLEQLSKWEVVGVKPLIEQYKVIEDYAGEHKFRVEKK